MAKSQPTPEPRKNILDQPGVEGTVQDTAPIAHAALQFQTTSGVVIRVYRMRMPGGVERVLAEKLRAGSMKIWDPVADVEVLSGDLNSAFGTCLGRCGQFLEFNTAL